MNSSKDLFHFVNTLSQNEKRNFSTLVKQKKEEDKKYFKLYNAFTKLNEYCPDKLKKRYKQVPTSKECSDLFSILLQNISSSSKVKSPQRLIREKLQNAEILYRRDLYEKSFKELEKVKKDAYKIEDYPVILEIIDKQRYVLRYLKFDKEKQQFLQKEHDRTIQILAIKSNLDLYWEQYLIIKGSKGKLVSEEMKTLELRVSELDEKNISTHQSSQLKIRYYYLLANISLQVGKSDKALNYNKLVIEEYNKKPNLKQANQEVYSNHLLGYFNCFLVLNQAKSIEENLLKEFESILKHNSKTSANSFENLYMFLCSYHLNLGNFVIFESFIEDLEKGLNKFKYKIKIEYQAVFISNVSSYYFLKGNFEKSRTWLHKQINHPYKQSNNERKAMSKLLDCVIATDIDDIDEFDNCIRRIIAYTKRENYNNPFIEDTIAFLKNYVASIPGNKANLSFLFEKQIEEDLKKSSEYRKPLFFVEILLWLKSKNNGKSIYDNFIASL